MWQSNYMRTVMLSMFLGVCRFLGYWMAAAVGYLLHWGMERPLALILEPVSRSHNGRRAFLVLTRLRLPPTFVAMLSVLGISLTILYRRVSALEVVGMGAIFLVIFSCLFCHRGRFLTISNQGASKWNVHLNVLRPNMQDQYAMWTGLVDEVDNLVQMLEAAQVNRLCFESTLLANEGSAQLLKRKLERTMAKQGLVAKVNVAQPKPKGTLLTGLIHVLIARQRALNSKRHVRHDRWNMKTRAIEVQISRSPSASPI